MVGPLGNPTHIENFGTVICAGGGVGVAPMLPIVKALKAAGNRVLSVLAGRTRDLIILEDEVRANSDETLIMTDDGSYGEKGVVTVGIEKLIQQEHIDKVFAIGPPIMMKFCCLLTKKYNIPTDVSLNTIMVDGTGMCGACRLTIGGKTKFVCIDGPEFDGFLVDWDEMFKRMGTFKRAEKEELLERFFAFLSQENEKYNLTAVTDREEVYCKHFADSLLVVDKLKSGTLLDVGSGGGMPAVPLAVAREDISFTLLEATGKKCEFLKRAISLLGLRNAAVVNGRAEELAKGEMREKFDTVTARAVARLNTLSEYCLPFVKVGGTFVAYKGNAEEEIKEAERAISLLGGRLKESCAFSLGGAKRTVLFIGKERPTPAQYPRGRGKERKNPL